MTEFCHNCFAVGFDGKCAQCGYISISDAGSNIMLQPGTMLNSRFLLGRVLGAGGFGVTYLAKDNVSGNKVAVKEYMPASFSVRSPDGRTIIASGDENAKLFEHGLAVFEREARTLESFCGNHSIVQVLHSFNENGTAYFVMEYLDGITLGGLARSSEGRLSIDNAMLIMKSTASALAAVHLKGMLHRDVSPDNILITRQGFVKLIDFGATRYFVGEKSRSLSVVLKAGYAPPEQYSSRGNQGPWTDIYALCATFYHMIAGKRPPDAPDRLDSPHLDNLRVYGLPTSIAMALEKGLELDYRRRQSSMDEFLAAISSESPVVRQAEPPAQKESLPKARQETSKVEPQLPEQPVLQAIGTPYLSLIIDETPRDRWILPKNMPMRIGRSTEKCHIVLDNKNVSRVHCDLKYDEKMSAFIITDLSTNGTFINGVRLEKNKSYRLEPGKRFYIMPHECGMEVGLC